MNPNPNCEREDCRFCVGVEMSTCVYYSPIYDKNGNNLNPDGNSTSGEISCSTCNKKWKYITRYNKTTYTEV